MTELKTLGVLDQSPISEGSTGCGGAREHGRSRCLVERLGYRRYWVAEHHGMPMLASPSPEVLIAADRGADDRRIRVGSGGVMLPHYSPLKVAETFSMLSGLYPGRIDLGLGRAPGSDHRRASRSQRDRRRRAPNDFPEQLASCSGYLEDASHRSIPSPASPGCPGGPRRPVVWLLGSSPQSAVWAAELGLPVRLRRLHQPWRRRARPGIPPGVRAVRTAAAAARRRRRLGHLRRHR